MPGSRKLLLQCLAAGKLNPGWQRQTRYNLSWGEICYLHDHMHHCVLAGHAMRHEEGYSTGARRACELGGFESN